jgi:hypothetical protein
MTNDNPMRDTLKQTTPPSEAGFIDKKKLQRRGRPSNPKSPELILWVVITMLLVKLAIILFGGTN